MSINCDFYEIERLKQMRIFESALNKKGYEKIAGVDEAGRGPLAGPLVVAACILPNSFFLEGLNDSKQLRKDKRLELYQQLTNAADVIFSYVVVEIQEIDKLNIFQATMVAMKKSVESLKVKPDYVLIDGNKMPEIKIKGEAIVSGDAKSISIAAASIIAKVKRDEIMIELQEKYQNFSFKKHKGYATKKHIEELQTYGPTPIHRRSFEPVKSMLLKRQQTFSF